MTPLSFALSIAGNAVSGMTPLLLAAMGGLFTELSGMLNIALEGLILFGAFTGALAAELTGSLLAGTAAGALCSGLLAWAYGTTTIRLKANVFITGLATNIFAYGITKLLSQAVYGSKGVIAFAVTEVPRLPQALGALNVFAPLSWLAVAATSAILWKTRQGARIRATGANPEAVAAAGMSPDRYRLAAIIASGLLCGIAGASLSLPLAAYVPNMSSGRGWIALVAVYLGSRKPGRIMIACFVFALAESYSIYAQGAFKVPAELVMAIPYAATLIALVASSLAEKNRDAARGD